MPAVNGYSDSDEINNEVPLKLYSESVSICKTQIPSDYMTYVSECIYSSYNVYRTSVKFVTKIIPAHFITTLEIQENEDQFTTSYDILPYFIRKTIPRNLEVTKDDELAFMKEYNYVTSLHHEPNYIEKRYISKLNLQLQGKTEVKIHLYNGDVPSAEYSETCNGYTSTDKSNSVVNGNDVVTENHNDLKIYPVHKVTVINPEDKTVREGEIWFTTSNCDKMFSTF